MAIPVVIAATIVENEGISGVVLFAGPEIRFVPYQPNQIRYTEL